MHFLLSSVQTCAMCIRFLVTNCRVIIKNVTVYTYVFSFASGNLYRLFILKALATIQIHLKCSDLY